MKKIMKTPKIKTFCLISILISFSAISENVATDKNVELALANKFLEVCINYANEDEVEEKDLLDYLVVCINDELEASDRKAMTYEQILKLIKKSNLVKLSKTEI